MNEKQLRLLLLIFSVILIVTGSILMLYYTEKKEVKIHELRDNEIKIEYQTIIENPYRIVGIHIFSLGLILIIIRFIYDKRKNSKKQNTNYPNNNQSPIHIHNAHAQDEIRSHALLTHATTPHGTPKSPYQAT